MNTKNLLVTAAVAGMLAVGANAQAKGKKAEGAKKGDKKVECHGVNECKGHGECHNADGSSCKGSNECKGKGWVSMTEKECKDKGGTTK
jgi:hypothetical protein